jgi:hypothetical protein
MNDSGTIETVRRVISTAPITVNLPALVDRWCPEDFNARTAARGVVWLSATPDFFERKLTCAIRCPYEIGEGVYTLVLTHDHHDDSYMDCYHPDGTEAAYDTPLGSDLKERPACLHDLVRPMIILWNALYWPGQE